MESKYSIAIGISKAGWKKIEYIYSNFQHNDQVIIDKFIASADSHVNMDGDQGLFYREVNLGSIGYVSFIDLLGLVDNKEYILFITDSEKDNMFFGNWKNNPFGIKFKLECNFIKGNASSNVVPQNDYTCSCGNNRCNKKEKSCWLCGAEIKQ